MTGTVTIHVHPALAAGAPAGDELAARMRDFGAGLRRYRRAAGLMQIELAARMVARGLPWHGSTVSKTESGDRPPHLSELHALAAVLDVDVLDLLNPLGGGEVIRAERAAAAAAGARLAGLVEQVAQVRAEQEHHLRAAEAALAGRSDRMAHLADDGSAVDLAGLPRLATTPARVTGAPAPDATPAQPGTAPGWSR